MSEKILITEDDEDLAFVIREALVRQGYEAEVAPTAGALLDRLKASQYDLILLDVRLPDMDGLDAIPRVRDLAPETPIIVMTAHGTRQIAINAITRGAYDFFTKPLKMAEFQVVVARALDRRRLQMQVRALREGQAAGGFEDLIGKSEALKRVLDMAQRAAPTDLTVLIQGESGTGKEIIANAIHAQSKRARGPLVKMNCAAVPETLLESELFGHEKGAFTGADRRRIGRFEQADGGTLFLDEVCEMHPRLQAKFLRGLQEREIERLGSSTPIPVDVRIIAATNRDLQQALQEGTLREDLYYRLNVILLHVPPLRERMDDVPILAMHFLRKYAAREGAAMAGIADEAMNVLLGYSWPGNVRELENAVERGVVLGQGEKLRAADLPPQVARRTDDEHPLVPAHLTLEEMEKLAIVQALRLTGGNKSEAAERLGIHRTSLYDKMRRYGITDPNARPPEPETAAPPAEQTH